MTEQPAEKFTAEQASYLASIIRIDRPRWDHGAIMKQLKIAAMGGVTISRVMGAAAKAINNPNHKTPNAINFDENWDDPKAKAAMDTTRPRVCMECTFKFPADQVNPHPSGHGSICNKCQTAA